MRWSVNNIGNQKMKEILLKFIKDRNIQIMLSASVFIFVSSYMIWLYVIERGDYFVYTVIGYFPLQLLSVVFLIHFLISIYAYNKEKNITYLACGSLLFFSLLTITIELMYIVNHG